MSERLWRSIRIIWTTLLRNWNTSHHTLTNFMIKPIFFKKSPVLIFGTSNPCLRNRFKRFVDLNFFFATFLFIPQKIRCHDLKCLYEISWLFRGMSFSWPWIFVGTVLSEEIRAIPLLEYWSMKKPLDLKFGNLTLWSSFSWWTYFSPLSYYSRFFCPQMKNWGLHDPSLSNYSIPFDFFFFR